MTSSTVTVSSQKTSLELPEKTFKYQDDGDNQSNSGSRTSSMTSSTATVSSQKTSPELTDVGEN